MAIKVENNQEGLLGPNGKLAIKAEQKWAGDFKANSESGELNLLLATADNQRYF